MAVSMRLREAMPCCHPPTPVRLQEKLRLLESSASEGLCRQAVWNAHRVGIRWEVGQDAPLALSM